MANVMTKWNMIRIAHLTNFKIIFIKISQLYYVNACHFYFSDNFCFLLFQMDWEENNHEFQSHAPSSTISSSLTPPSQCGAPQHASQSWAHAPGYAPWTYAPTTPTPTYWRSRARERWRDAYAGPFSKSGKLSTT